MRDNVRHFTKNQCTHIRNYIYLYRIRNCGGSLLSAKVLGKRCAEIALQILGGHSPTEIPPDYTLNQLMFDWRQLNRWGISEKNLPPGSIVRYKAPSLWKDHKRGIIGVTVAITVQALFIFFLLVQRTRRKRAEHSLIEAESNYRTVADFTYDWEYWADLDGSLRYVSPACERISGYKPREFIEASSLFRKIIIPEDREIWDQENKGVTH